MLARHDARLGEQTYRSVIGIRRNDWSMRLLFDEVENLTIAVEEHHASLHHVLEDEILVVVADLKDVARNQVIDGRLPPGSCFVRLCIVVDFLLCDLGVEDLFVHARAQMWRDAALSILHEERLVVFGE